MILFFIFEFDFTLYLCIINAHMGFKTKKNPIQDAMVNKVDAGQGRIYGGGGKGGPPNVIPPRGSEFSPPIPSCVKPFIRPRVVPIVVSDSTIS